MEGCRPCTRSHAAASSPQAIPRCRAPASLTPLTPRWPHDTPPSSTSTNALLHAVVLNTPAPVSEVGRLHQQMSQPAGRVLALLLIEGHGLSMSGHIAPGTHCSLWAGNLAAWIGVCNDTVTVVLSCRRMQERHSPVVQLPWLAQHCSNNIVAQCSCVCLQEDSLDGSSPALQLPLSGTVDEHLWLEGSAPPAQSSSGAQKHLEMQALLCLQQQHRNLEHPAAREPAKPAGSPLMLGAWANQQASYALQLACYKKLHQPEPRPSSRGLNGLDVKLSPNWTWACFRLPLIAAPSCWKTGGVWDGAVLSVVHTLLGATGRSR